MIKIGCNYLSFKGAANELSVEDFIRMSYDLRLDTIDFHHRAFTSSDPAYLLKIKRMCLDYGLPIGYVGVAAGGTGTVEERLRERVKQSKAAIDDSVHLGAPLIRVFGFSAEQSDPNRDALFTALANAFREICEYGADKGVVVALQNHNNRNLAADAEGVLRILREVDHPNMAYIMDTGQWKNFYGSSGTPNPTDDGYKYMEQVMPYACYVRTKFYEVASGVEKRLDYERIMPILKKNKFNGSISIVYEGAEPGDRVEIIRKSAAHLRKLIVKHSM
ncbi:MAG: sugar phosphate isomerase/epimerase [SAR202 cluster bacterium]|nr:sugar phosphate isomerase/epimerase [SAR202 cluster bacterium]